ncbi:MAG: HEPN domain-containing protein [bacterium]
MTEGDELNTILAEWVEKAEADLTCATRLLGEKEQWSAEIICFHAQQCVEKYIKVLLVLSRTDFPKTHDIRHLVDMLPPDVRPDLSTEEQDRLTPYATATRYPGGLEPATTRQAAEAVRIARRVRDQVRRRLPRQALRRRRK